MPTDQTNTTVLEGVTEALVTLGSEREQVTPDATLEALDIDSLDLAELAQIVDERYGVQVAAGDVANIRTVGDLVALIEDRA